MRDSSLDGNQDVRDGHADWGQVPSPTSAHWSILILSRHATLAASSRLRTNQYVPFLRSKGADVMVAPFFDERYLRKLYESGGRDATDVARGYLRRAMALAGLRRASVVWIEKEVFPFLPGFIEAIPARMGVRYVVDYDDATFHTYDNNSGAFVRRALANKLDALLAGAQAVTAGSAYLEAYARTHGAKCVVRIPTVVDLTRYLVKARPAGDEIRIGWIGTPATTAYLQLLQEPLREVARSSRIRLVTVGAGKIAEFGVPLEQHAWSADTEAELLSTMAIGVMPLPDAPWERGKCGYKLVQYMAAGRPVIASSVGANVDIVTPRVGILADGAAAWCAALRSLVENAGLRSRLGAQARKDVEAFYSLQATAPKVCAILARAAAVA